MHKVLPYYNNVFRVQIINRYFGESIFYTMIYETNNNIKYNISYFTVHQAYNICNTNLNVSSLLTSIKYNLIYNYLV